MSGNPLLQGRLFLDALRVHVDCDAQGNLVHQGGERLCWCLPTRRPDEDGAIFYHHRRISFN